MLVIALVGPSGAGKTTVANMLSESFDLYSRSYKDIDRFRLDSGWILGKWSFVAQWYEALIERQRSGETIVVADRAPICAAAYVTHCQDEMVAVCQQSAREFASLGNEVKTLLLTAPTPVLLRRAYAKEAAEPDRQRFRERDPVHSARVWQFYESHPELWDARMDTSVHPSSHTAGAIGEWIRGWL